MARLEVMRGVQKIFLAWVLSSVAWAAYEEVWRLGEDDGNYLNDFVQESHSSEAAPGQVGVNKDEHYYLAGACGAGIGEVLEDEATAL